MKIPKKNILSLRGQSITELALVLPLLLLLALGAIEVANIVNTYLTITHLTREGANMTSRGIDPVDALDAVEASGAPLINSSNSAQWKIIYSQIGPDDPTVPTGYQVSSQIRRGGLAESSVVGAPGATVTSSEIPNIDSVALGQTFEMVEIFYDYAPDECGTAAAANLNCPLTPLQSFTERFFSLLILPTLFYERTVFTNVS